MNIVRGVVLSAVVAASFVMTSSALAHGSKQVHRHVSPLTKNVAVTGAPDCSASFDVRRRWAGQKAAEQTPAKQGGLFPFALWRNMVLCEGEDTIIDGQRVAAPKAAGRGLPADFQIDVVAQEIVDGPETPAKLARNHGSCTNFAWNPTISGSNFYSEGVIQCSGSVPLRTDIDGLRKYDASGLIVTQANGALDCCVTSTIKYSGPIYYKCPWGSTYISSFTGDRYHAGAWGGSTVWSSTWTSPVAACQ